MTAFVEVTGDRNEVGDEVERHEQVRDQGRENELLAASNAGIRKQSPEEDHAVGHERRGGSCPFAATGHDESGDEDRVERSSSHGGPDNGLPESRPDGDCSARGDQDVPCLGVTDSQRPPLLYWQALLECALDPARRPRARRLGSACAIRGSEAAAASGGLLESTLARQTKGQFTTRDVRLSVTAPALRASCNCSNERTRLRCAPVFQVTSTTAHSGG